MLDRHVALTIALFLVLPASAAAQLRRDPSGQAVDEERAPSAMGLTEEEARERRQEELELRMRRERERRERLRREREHQERLRREREERERLRAEQARQERIRRERAERRRREREERERQEAEEQARLERERHARSVRRRREREEREAREAEEREEQERQARADRARRQREERARIERERVEQEAREAREAELERQRAQRERERLMRVRAERDARARAEHEAEELEARESRDRQQRRRRVETEQTQDEPEDRDDPEGDEEPESDEDADDETDEAAPPPAARRTRAAPSAAEAEDGTADDGWAEEDGVEGDGEADAEQEEEEEAADEEADDARPRRATRRETRAVERAERSERRSDRTTTARRAREAREDDDDHDADDDDDDQEDEDDDDDSIPITFGGSSTLIFERRADNGDDVATDDNYYDGIMRAQAALEIGRVRLSTRIDGALFLDNPEGADRRNDIRPERVLLEGETDLGPLALRVAAGDFYAQLGRGLILSLRRVDEIGVDTALRGGRIEVGGREGGWNLQVMGGLSNPANLENQQLLHVEDPGDFIGGARVEARLEGAMLALHSAWARVGEGADEELGADQTWAFGGEVETTLRDVTVAFEMDWQARRRSGEDERGFALYGTVSAPIGPLTLLGELKHYSEFEVMRGSVPTNGGTAFAYSAPPTAERMDQEILDNTDVTGGRVQGDLAVGDASTLMLSGGLFYDRYFDRWFSHVYGGGDHRWTSGASFGLHAGYRREWEVENGELTRAIVHGEADAIVPVTRDWSAHATVRHQSQVEVITAEERPLYHRGTATLELDYRHQISFTGGFEWDTHTQSPGAPQTYGFGLVTWSPNDIVTLRMLAGTQRGGLKCLAGACRMYPPFAGGRLDISVRF